MQYYGIEELGRLEAAICTALEEVGALRHSLARTENRLRICPREAEPAVDGRCLSIAATKLEEALLWLRNGNRVPAVPPSPQPPPAAAPAVPPAVLQLLQGLVAGGHSPTLVPIEHGVVGDGNGPPVVPAGPPPTTIDVQPGEVEEAENPGDKEEPPPPAPPLPPPQSPGLPGTLPSPGLPGTV